VFKSTYLALTPATTAAQFSATAAIAPSLNGTSADPGALVARQYQEYVCTSHGIKYTPAVGTTTAGTVWLAWIDNPEIIYKFVAGTYTYSDALTIAQTVAHHKSGPVWEAMDFSVSLPPRRKLFSVDTTSAGSAEVADRTMQGMYIVVSTAVPINTNPFGYVTTSYTCRVRGLQSLAATGI